LHLQLSPMKFFNIPPVLPLTLRGLVWSLQDKSSIYLTFDDGPHPEITPWVLDVLKKYNLKATFFCVGTNAGKYPKIVNRILAEGHSLGNHTYSHLNGWQYTTEEYVQDVLLCREVFGTNLFRPPFGKITPMQAYTIKKIGFEIIMWNILSYDYDKRLNINDCKKKLTASSGGDIIVFHDSEKAFPNLKELLPEFCSFLNEKRIPGKAL
jgi:peptidoglycan-N-acetylglucosamine deacetylase